MPGRRDVRRLCEILLGGDRIGQVGYDALPPLARDVYDRLAPLGLNLEKRTIQRALLDLARRPGAGAAAPTCCGCCATCCPPDAVRPIMGERRLGRAVDPGELGPGHRHAPARPDRARLRGRHRRAGAGAAAAPRGVGPAGHRRRSRSRAVEDAIAVPAQPPVRRRAGRPGRGAARRRAHRRRRARGAAPHPPAAGPLPGHRAGAAGLVRGVRHRRVRALLHPAADRVRRRGDRRPAGRARCSASCSAWRAWRCRWAATGPSWNWPCAQSHPEAPAKVALLWAAQHQLGLLPLAELRARCDELLANPLVVPAFPQYLSGFVQALEPVAGAGAVRGGDDVARRSPGCPTRCCCPGCRR